MKKNKKIIIILFIFFIAFSSIMSKGIGDLDELWNYNFARNIADGLIPYKDFNLVQTPLLPMICAIFLKILGNELIIMRFLSAILMTSIFYISYKILRILIKEENGKISLFSIMIIIFMFNNIFCIDYNYATLLIALILTLLELKDLEKNEEILSYNLKKDFVIGLIAGIGILFKQTTGVCIAIACIGYKLLAVRNKNDIIKFVKIAITRLIGVIIPCVLMIIYLIINNALDDFIDYAILGISTFSNKIPYVRLFNQVWYIKILAVVVPITLIIMFIKIFLKKKDNKILILFSYGISSFVVAYPISDKIHFLIGSLITILGIIYILNTITSKFDIKLKIKAIFYAIISGCAISVILLQLTFSISYMYVYIKNSKEKELKHFTGITENKDFDKNIIEVGKYIKSKKEQGQNVYILDAEASIYMIPLDIYNKNYDMFNKGNFGSKGEKGIIENFALEENAIYLIKSDNYSRNWQNPEMVRKYIKDNFTKIGQIYIFDIYEK